MKKIAIMLSIIFLLSISLKPILPEDTLPYTETVEIGAIEDYYTLNLLVPVYLKKRSTYEDEYREIRIEIGPRKEKANYNLFIELLVAAEIKKQSKKNYY